MQRIPPKGKTIRGIDIYWGDMISDINVLAQNISYAFLKAFEYKADPRFELRWESCKTHGILRGAYDFFHPSRDPIAQAEHFLSLLKGMDEHDLPCILDWESTDGMPADKDRESAYLWLQTVEKATKKVPIIYISPYFALALRLDSRFKRYPLWVANYGVSVPSVPSPWDNWAFWQNIGDTGSIAGIRGHCDLDLFNGSVEDLKAFIAASIVRS